MKKYLAVFVCCLALGMGLNVHLQIKSNQINPIGISLANIEALAQGEGNQTDCPYVGCIDCPHGNVKVLYVE